jgi:hypothetical protein
MVQRFKRKFFINIFEFIGQFYFQSDIFKLQEFVSELGITVFRENGLGSFQTFLILQIWEKPELLWRFQKQFWKLNSIPKTLVFIKYLLVSYRSHSIRTFLVLLDDSLRIISETWRAEKNLKQIRTQRTKIKEESLIFFKRQNRNLQKFSSKKH